MGDLADARVAKYIVAVIMAPMPDDEQKPEVASTILSRLTSNAAEAWWILGSDGRRVGVIAFTVGPYSEKEKTKVLYVVGFNFPKEAPASAWTTLIEHGRAVAKDRGCRYIMFDVAPNGPHTERIIEAAIDARAQVRFTLEA